MDHAATEGAVETMTTGLADEIARAVPWLTGPEASFVTGSWTS